MYFANVNVFRGGTIPRRSYVCARSTACCVHSIEYVYHAQFQLQHGDGSGAVRWQFWLLMAAEAAVTFLILWPVLKFPILGRLVLIDCCAGWFIFASSVLEATTK